MYVFFILEYYVSGLAPGSAPDPYTYMIPLIRQKPAVEADLFLSLGRPPSLDDIHTYFSRLQFSVIANPLLMISM